MKMPLISLVFSLCIGFVVANPASLTFQDCFDDTENENQRLQVDSVYAQVLQDDLNSHYLNLTVFGSSPNEIVGISNSSSLCKPKIDDTTVNQHYLTFMSSNSIHDNFCFDSYRMVK